MSNPEHRSFNAQKQYDFDFVFPPNKIRDFEEGGDSDWIGIFDALRAFNFGINPQGEKPVLDMILAHEEGSKLIVRDTKEGLMIYRRNVNPLLKSIFSLGTDIMHFWDDEARKRIDDINKTRSETAMKAIARAQRDWQR